MRDIEKPSYNARSTDALKVLVIGLNKECSSPFHTRLCDLHVVDRLTSKNAGAGDGVGGDWRPVDVDLDSGVRAL